MGLGQCENTNGAGYIHDFLDNLKMGWEHYAVLHDFVQRPFEKDSPPLQSNTNHAPPHLWSRLVDNARPDLAESRLSFLSGPSMSSSFMAREGLSHPVWKGSGREGGRVTLSNGWGRRLDQPIWTSPSPTLEQNYRCLWKQYLPSY